MKYTSKKFIELKEGEHFWAFDTDVGDPDIERVKLKGASSGWADHDPGMILFPSDFVVYVKRPSIFRRIINLFKGLL